MSTLQGHDAQDNLFELVTLPYHRFSPVLVDSFMAPRCLRFKGLKLHQITAKTSKTIEIRIKIFTHDPIWCFPLWSLNLNLICFAGRRMQTREMKHVC